MTSIHPTAIVGGGVSLGADVVIGAYAIVGGRASIGDSCWIGAHAVIGAPPEVRDHPHPDDWIESDSGPGVSIGNGTVLREAVHVQGGWKRATTLGANLFVMNQVYIAHDGQLADGVTIASSATLGGHVVLGTGANLGLGTTVHQRRVVGAWTMLGMSSVVTHDIPPFVKAFGSPCRVHGINEVGLARQGFSDEEVRWAASWIDDPDSAEAAPAPRLEAAVDAYLVARS
jgi:UDP-N-acetylglucosamine acyltransferase